MSNEYEDAKRDFDANDFVDTCLCCGYIGVPIDTQDEGGGIDCLMCMYKAALARIAELEAELARLKLLEACTIWSESQQR